MLKKFLFPVIFPDRATNLRRFHLFEILLAEKSAKNLQYIREFTRIYLNHTLQVVLIKMNSGSFHSISGLLFFEIPMKKVPGQNRLQSS